MLIDTHCHLNFKAFEGRIEEVINNAKKVGVDNIIIPGTDVATSQKAVEIAEKYDGVYAAVGIHPHHVFEYQRDIIEIERLLKNPKVVAIGEVGMDKHYYQKTKYKNYQINPELVEGQKKLFIEQIKLAHQYKKALIIHNREAKKEVLKILNEPAFAKASADKAVFHCCEPDKELLDFAIAHKMFIGIDGDIFYRKDKQEFIKNIPLKMLVLETDSPFLLPEPLRTKNILRLRQGFGLRPTKSATSDEVGGQSNEPKNIPLIAEFIAKLRNTSIKCLIEVTTENAKRLFEL